MCFINKRNHRIGLYNHLLVCAITAYTGTGLQLENTYSHKIILHRSKNISRRKTFQINFYGLIRYIFLPTLNINFPALFWVRGGYGARFELCVNQTTIFFAQDFSV